VVAGGISRPRYPLSMPVAPDSAVLASEDVLTRRVGEELVLLNMATEVYFGLDPVGTAMWEALVTHGSVAAAHAALAPQYDVEPERLLADLTELAGQLVEKGLLTVRGA
jgi:hypothetical protein